MNNLTKKIFVVAIFLSCVNSISAEQVKFYPVNSFKQNATWDTVTNIVTTQDNTITYSDIVKREGYIYRDTQKNPDPKLSVDEGYKFIGTYKAPVSNVTGTYVYQLYGKNYTR